MRSLWSLWRRQLPALQTSKEAFDLRRNGGDGCIRRGGGVLMNTIDAVITRILDVRPYRHFWIVEVEMLSWGRYSNTTIIRDSEKEVRQVQPSDTVMVWVVHDDC